VAPPNPHEFHPPLPQGSGSGKRRLRLQVVWIFSLPRSGSSVTAYAAAAPWGHAVADEPLGPWDRTGPPYNYPPIQRELYLAHHAAGCRLTPEVVAMARELFGVLGERTGTVIVKHPHLRPPPEEFREAFPDHTAVWLIRNPLVRLNSLYARGWTDQLRPNYELGHFKAFAQNWRSQRQRLIFEDLKKNPRRFFRRLYRFWGWRADEEQVERAVEYTRGHYHASSGELEERRADGPVSERHWRLPEEAMEMYLSDPTVRKLMGRAGWPRSAGAYRESESRLERRWQRLLGRNPAPRAG
jgi:hypothetical protein